MQMRSQELHMFRSRMNGRSNRIAVLSGWMIFAAAAVTNPVATAAATAAALRAPLIILPDCGHVPYVEAPDAFVAALDPFLPRA